MKSALKRIVIISLQLCTLLAQQEEIDNYLSTCHDRGLFDGVALVAKGDSLIYLNGFGIADRVWGTPHTRNTRFNIGSLTKQFVTVVTLQMIGEGSLDIDATISEYLPLFRNDIGHRVTIDQLLKHTSGIIPFTSMRGVDNLLERQLSKEELIKSLYSSDLEFEPGERYKYNNTGFCLLVNIIENVSNMAWSDILNERLLAPLKMHNSGLIKSGEITEQLAEGYVLDVGGYHRPRYMNIENIYGAGGMYSTAEDLYTWNRALSEGVLLPEKYNSWIFKPYDEFRKGNGHGYSMDITTLFSRESKREIQFAHYNGAHKGYLCETSRIFDGDYYIILLSNIGHNINIWSIETGIRNLLLNESYRVPLPSLCSELYKSVGTEKFNALLLGASQRHGSFNSEYSVDEYQLNMLGYKLMWANHLDYAEKIFELNTILYPASANAYDSLAEIYVSKNQHELAIFNYKKALNIDPTSTSAREALNDLENE